MNLESDKSKVIMDKVIEFQEGQNLGMTDEQKLIIFSMEVDKSIDVKTKEVINEIDYQKKIIQSTTGISQEEIDHTTREFQLDKKLNKNSQDIKQLAQTTQEQIKETIANIKIYVNEKIQEYKNLLMTPKTEFVQNPSSEGLISRREFLSRLGNLLVSVSVLGVVLKPSIVHADMYESIAKIFGYEQPVGEVIEKTVNEAMEKLSIHINKYSNELGINARTVGGVIYVEMFRSLTTPKGYIEKKMLGYIGGRILLSIKNATYGVGQMTSTEMMNCIQNLKDPNSPFYLGEKFSNYLSLDDYEKALEHTEEEHYGVIHTEDKNAYIQIKFAAAMIAQFSQQWKNAGFDISKKPEILGTLYNLGFKKSHPHKNPKSGGTMNFIFGKSVNFGGAVKLWADSKLAPEIKASL